jgi:plasmid stability protein
MASMTIRNIPDDVHLAIHARAKRHGRSAEAEVRMILEAAARRPAAGLRIGDELASVGRAFGGIDLDLQRPKMPMRTAKFS